MRRGLTIIVSGPDPDRLTTALGVAGAEAALGGRVRLFFDRGAVRAAATLNGEARELLEVALDLGATAILCQTGLAAAGLAADTLDARFEMGGLVDLLAPLDDDRLIVA